MDNTRILHFDDWDDVFKWREYIETGTQSEKNKGNCDGGGCNVLFWIIVVFLICLFLIINRILKC